MNSLKLRQAIRTKYAWPGGYPMALLMTDGATICMDCARQEYKQIAYANLARYHQIGMHTVSKFEFFHHVK